MEHLPEESQSRWDVHNDLAIKSHIFEHYAIILNLSKSGRLTELNELSSSYYTKSFKEYSLYVEVNQLLTWKSPNLGLSRAFCALIR